MGCPHDIKVRAGPNVPLPQRPPGITPLASVPARLKSSSSSSSSSPLATPWFHHRFIPEEYCTMYTRNQGSISQLHHGPFSPQRAEGPRRRGGLYPEPALLLRNSLCKCLILQHVTFVAKAPKMRVASPLASLSPQRGEGLRVRGGHIQSCLPSVSSCISTTRRPS